MAEDDLGPIIRANMNGFKVNIDACNKNKINFLIENEKKVYRTTN